MDQEKKDRMAAARLAGLQKKAREMGIDPTGMVEGDIHRAMAEVRKAQRDAADAGQAVTPPTPVAEPAPAPVATAFSDEQKEAIAQMIDKAVKDATAGNSSKAGTDAAAIAAEITKVAAETFQKSMAPKIDKATGYHNPDYIDPDDRLKVPRVYFAPRFYENISFTMVRGVPEALPMGWQRFFPDTAAQVRHGNEQTFKYVAKAVVYSKKQAEALDNHEQFGIKFHSNEKAARGASEDRMEIEAKWATILGTKGFEALCQIASSQNPPIPVQMHDSTAAIRRRLIALFADREIADMGVRAEQLKNAGNRETLLMTG